MIVKPGDGVAALVAGAPCVGIFGHLLLPDEDPATWEAAAVEYFKRQR